jgi:tetratricopeptide (TPR) repeat protein
MLPYRRVVVLSLLGLLLAGWAIADWYYGLPEDAVAHYVGRKTCAQCHQGPTDLWTGSDHDRAMERATEQTVLGDFDDAQFRRFGVTTRLFRQDDQYWVNTEGPDGKLHDYQIQYTFGITPLQQYMVEFPDGRVQVLRVSWDTEKKEWFYVAPPDVKDEKLEPGDPLHWTGLAQNWNTMCAECHSTDVRKNYDLKANTYHTTFEEIDVSCEACHGPGSLHVQLARSRSPFWDRQRGYALAGLNGADNRRQVGACAPCHSRRSQIHADYHAGGGLARDGYAENGRQAPSFTDYFEPALLAPGLYHADGQILDEVYVYGSFLQSRMYYEGVRCTDCHDPHSLQLKFPGNRLCTECHLPGKYDSPAHHHHQVETDAAQCVSCHMPSRTYMEIDDRRDHSLRIPRPDLTEQIGTPNACNGCHAKSEETAAWAAAAVVQWYGKGSRPAAALPGDRWSRGTHYAVAFHAARQNLPEGKKLLRDLLHRKVTPDIVRATAVELLAGYPSPESVKSCREALRHDSPLVRTTAVRTIASGLLEQYVQEVAGRLSDPSRMVRMAAAGRLVAHAKQLTHSEFRVPLQKAIEEYKDGQQVMLDRAGSHLNLAGMHEQLGNLAAARREMRTAIRIEPYLTGPRGELARLLDQLNSHETQAEIRTLRTQEVELLQRDFLLLPSAPMPHYRHGMLLYLLDEPVPALESLREACRLDPNSYRYWLALALLCEKEQLWSETLEALRNMQRIQPEDPTIRGIYMRMQEAKERKAESGKRKAEN